MNDLLEPRECECYACGGCTEPAVTTDQGVPVCGARCDDVVRETMDQITTSLAAAIPAHQEIHDHAMHGAVRIAVDNRVDHRVAVTGMVEHVGLPMPADV